MYPNLPNLIEAPQQVIAKCTSVSDFHNAIEYFKANFDAVQPMIKHFLADHTKAKRSHYMERLIESLNNA